MNNNNTKQITLKINQM